jgi:hypothetical protein
VHEGSDDEDDMNFKFNDSWVFISCLELSVCLFPWVLMTYVFYWYLDDWSFIGFKLLFYEDWVFFGYLKVYIFFYCPRRDD